MKNASWLWLALSVFSLSGCDQTVNELFLGYDLVVFDSSGGNVGKGELELEFADATRDSDRRSIAGTWRWEKALLGTRSSGPLIGGIKFDGTIWIDFQLNFYATDTNMDLEGRWVEGITFDIEGHVFYTGIYGRRNKGDVFLAVLR